MNLVLSTKSWLASNAVYVPEEWVTACIEWIQEENQGSHLSQDQINGMVYEQWLLADLHELGTQCLPQEVMSSGKYQLTGSYALQIDSIVDAGQPLYSQLQKVKGRVNDNVHVSADEPTQKPWEPKPSHMLVMKLTDGVNDVQGIEYKAITSLNTDTHLGAKILVQGEVLCRHGVMMLTDSNVRYLGGEVDTLMDANPPEVVLQRAMTVNTEHSNKSHRQEFAGGNATCVKKAGGVGMAQKPVYRGTVHGPADRKERFFPKAEPIIKQEVHSQTLWQNNTSRQRTNVANIPVGGDEQWDEELNYDAFMDDMVDDFEPGPSSSSCGTVQTPSAPRNTNQNNAFRQNISYTGDNGIITNGSRNLGNVNTSEQGGSGRSGDSLKLRLGNYGSGHVSQLPGKNNVFPRNIENKKNSPKPLNITHVQKLATNKRKRDSETGYEGETTFKRCMENSEDDATSIDNFDAFDDEDDIDLSQIVEMDTASIEIQEENRLNSSNESNTIRSHTSRLSISSEEGNTPGPSKVCSLSEKLCRIPNVQICSTKQEIVSQPAASGNKQVTLDSYFSPSKIANFAEQKQNKDCRSAEKPSAVRKELLPEEAIDEEKPFTYLIKIQRRGTVSEPRKHVVKAYVSTLISRLSSAEGRWSLVCKINDGSAAMDVDLSNQVLTKLIGFSAEDSQVMKKRAKIDPGVRDVLTEGIQQCQQKLIDLNCLLELEVRPGQARPEVTDIRPVERCHVDQLERRVAALKRKI